MTKVGIKKPTGPLTRVAQPAAKAPIKYHRIRCFPSYSSARKQAKIVEDTKKASVISKMTIRENAIYSGVDDIINTANMAVRRSYILRQKKNTATTSENPNKAEESLAIPSDSPNISKDRATVLK